MVFDIFKIPCLTQYLIHSVSSVNICEFKNDEIKKKKNDEIEKKTHGLRGLHLKQMIESLFVMLLPN